MKYYLSLILLPLIITISSQATLAESKEKLNSLPEEIQSIEIETKEPNQTEIEKNSELEWTEKYNKLVKADKLYLAGDKKAAEAIYRQVKQPFVAERENIKFTNLPNPIYQPTELSPAGKVFWRNYQQGKQKKLRSKILAPLQLLVERNPEFIPGHIEYAKALREYEQPEKSLQVLQKAVSLYPNESLLVKAKIEADNLAKQYLEASITARQFALFNPKHPEAGEFLELAELYLDRYKDDLNEKLTWNAIGNVVTGGIGYALTGNIFGPLSALDTTILLLRGESEVGNSFAKRAKKELPLMEDEEVLAYIQSIGNKLVSVAGRDEFDYEFYLVMDDSLNAFALPGGKVFIHVGAILKTDSEAQLAGLIAHELSHAVLSHSFKLLTEGRLTTNVTRYIPYIGGLAGNLIVLDYSRDMENQADLFGTRMLVASDYAADGLHGLMLTLAAENAKKENFSPPEWLSTHPETKERILHLEQIIVNNGFNRYKYEGVEKHQAIKQKVQKLWAEYQKTEEYRQRQKTKK